MFCCIDKDTNNPIGGVRVFLESDLTCDYSGCGRLEFGYEYTGSDGNTCITISQSQMEKVTYIRYYKEEYKYFEIKNPPSNLNVIYLEKY